MHAALPSQFGCERYRLSRFSPGPVGNDEMLNLIITDPQSLDQRSGRLSPIVAKYIYEHGMSVLRDAAADVEFERTYNLLKQSSDEKGRPRYFHGVCIFSARTLRYNNQQRFAGVYDTGYRDRPHHADIMAPVPTARIDKERNLKTIIDKISPGFVDAARFRDGSFARFSRQHQAQDSGL